MNDDSPWPTPIPKLCARDRSKSCPNTCSGAPICDVLPEMSKSDSIRARVGARKLPVEGGGMPSKPVDGPIAANAGDDMAPNPGDEKGKCDTSCGAYAPMDPNRDRIKNEFPPTDRPASNEPTSECISDGWC